MYPGHKLQLILKAALVLGFYPKSHVEPFKSLSKSLERRGSRRVVEFAFEKTAGSARWRIMRVEKPGSEDLLNT